MTTLKDILFLRAIACIADINILKVRRTFLLGPKRPYKLETFYDHSYVAEVCMVTEGRWRVAVWYETMGGKNDA